MKKLLSIMLMLVMFQSAVHAGNWVTLTSGIICIAAGTNSLMVFDRLKTQISVEEKNYNKYQELVIKYSYLEGAWKQNEYYYDYLGWNSDEWRDVTGFAKGEKEKYIVLVKDKKDYINNLSCQAEVQRCIGIASLVVGFGLVIEYVISNNKKEKESIEKSVFEMKTGLNDISVSYKF